MKRKSCEQRILVKLAGGTRWHLPKLPASARQLMEHHSNSAEPSDSLKTTSMQCDESYCYSR